MDKFKILNRIKTVYENGGNIIRYLKDLEGQSNNSLEDILISYDFQAGSYIKAYEKEPKIKDMYCEKLAEIIDDIGDYDSLIEVGVGEATTLGNVLKLIRNKSVTSYGFDISWSRIKYAKKFLQKQNLSNVNLFVADLFCLPLKDNCIDIVYTSHSIEPNGGKEREALMELYRITNKYLILLEPAYELANEEARNRMRHYGYVTNLYSMANDLGYNIIEHKLFGINTNPLNPTGLIIIKKDGKAKETNLTCCPVTKKDLILINNCYFSEESFLLYPIVEGIPCLLPQNAILATKFLD
ncbi:methyltransferase domain-containing protein [Clostridium sp. Cult2]|uniref:methyltransferase domain-containing protein n=1 Tax=Clostridium sp. Cult2 TaxID=2079003 RepID=UPI001F41F932|nr:methyltransferase domain-containing protein [Clostridium sp. Cult2]MCF6465224.1 hypothetical protein [Clostridium sp. Cult2]